MKLRPSQSQAAKVIAQGSVLLLADVGSGKTATVLTAIRRKRLMEPKRTLVLGTNRICNMVWPVEATQWAPELRVESVAGKVAHKRKAMMEDPGADVVCLNFANVAWAIKEYDSKLPEMFPWLVIDESSKMENPISKSCQALYKVLKDFEWRIPMTGTPRANYLHDIWGSAYLADLGNALGKSKEAFFQNWFYTKRTTFGCEWVPKALAEQSIYQELRASCYRMAFDGEKPQVQEINIMLPLHVTVDEWQRYTSARLKAGDKTVTIHGGDITIAREGNRVAMKYIQMASGLIYTDEGETIQIHTEKLDALQEIIDEAKGEPAMVVVNYTHERDALLQRFPVARVLDKSPETLSDWNAGKIPMLLVHPASCGHGLNAQFGGALQVWFSPPLDAEFYVQTIGRLARPGQKSPLVRVLRLIMNGTEDMRHYNTVCARAIGDKQSLAMLG